LDLDFGIGLRFWDLTLTLDFEFRIELLLRDWTLTLRFDFGIGLWLWTSTFGLDCTYILGFDFEIGIWLWEWTLTLRLDFDFEIGVRLWESFSKFQFGFIFYWQGKREQIPFKKPSAKKSSPQNCRYQNKSPLKFHEIKRGAPPPYSRMIWKGGGRVALTCKYVLLQFTRLQSHNISSCILEQTMISLFDSFVSSIHE